MNVDHNDIKLLCEMVARRLPLPSDDAALKDIEETVHKSMGSFGVISDPEIMEEVRAKRRRAMDIRNDQRTALNYHRISAVLEMLLRRGKTNENELIAVAKFFSEYPC